MIPPEWTVTRIVAIHSRGDFGSILKTCEPTKQTCKKDNDLCHPIKKQHNSHDNHKNPSDFDDDSVVSFYPIQLSDKK